MSSNDLTFTDHCLGFTEKLLFSLGDLFGPHNCEKDDCVDSDMTAWHVLLTRPEVDLLAKRTGPDALYFINHERLGVALCPVCLKKELEIRKSENKGGCNV